MTEASVITLRTKTNKTKAYPLRQRASSLSGSLIKIRKRKKKIRKRIPLWAEATPLIDTEVTDHGPGITWSEHNLFNFSTIQAARL